MFYQRSKYIHSVLSDLTFTSTYWDFLERTLELFLQRSDKSSENKKDFLSHFTREIKNFESYALHDLQEDQQNKFYSTEYFLTYEILRLCDLLGGHYKIQVETATLWVDEATREPITPSEELASQVTLKTTTKSQEANNKFLFFMEQLMFWRKKQPDHSIPVVTDSMFKAFSTYILPPTGPFIISPPQIEKLADVPSAKEVKAQNALAKTTPQPTDLQPTTISGPAAASASPTTPKESSPKIRNAVFGLSSWASIAAAPAAASTSTPTTIESSPKIRTTALSPSLSNSATLTFSPSQRLNIRDVRLHIEHRTELSYTDLFGKLQAPSFFRDSLGIFEKGFLNQIKGMIHLSPTTSKLPNIAKLYIEFQYQVEGQHKSIAFDEVFLNGGKFFGKSDLDFKKRHKIIYGFDLISDADRAFISKCEIGRLGIPLGIAMERNLRKKVIGGPWRSNCLDSEAVGLVWLTEELPSIMKKLSAENGFKPITLIDFVLGISSYRDCCPNCQKLIQGFQINLKATLEEFKISNIFFDPNFATLALTYGHTRQSHPSKYPQSALPTFLKGAANLEAKQHKFICVQNCFS